MSYQRPNRAKANFSNVYHAATPHNYFALMDSLDYRIGEEAQPYFRAGIELIRRQNERPRVQMLDLGCSYGVGSALVKYQFSFDQIAKFFDEEASRDYTKCVRDTRQWLKEEEEAPLPMKCVGMDCSGEALRFAEEADLLDAGISKNFEENPNPSDQEIQLIRDCNLMTSTGAVGYITEKTLAVVLSHLGKGLPDQHGPYVVVTILRMFNSNPIQAVFEKFGYRFEQMSGIRLRQRHFADESEKSKTIQLLNERNINPQGWEAEGNLYADLYVGAPVADFPPLATTIREIHDQLVMKKSTSALT